MKFEELSKEHQKLLMYCLLSYIEGKIRKGAMDEIIFPSYKEYKAFFDEFDKEYEIVDGLPESQACNPFSVKFKVVLEVLTSSRKPQFLLISFPQKLLVKIRHLS